MTERLSKVNQLIRQEIGRILQKELLFPGCLLTVLSVSTAKNLRSATVAVSVFPFARSQQVLAVLRQRRGFLQGQLHRKLYMKPLPEINFILDDSPEKTKHVEELLRPNQNNGTNQDKSWGNV